jgi:hypothetical protein
MRHALVAAILLVSSSAIANPKEIEKVAKSSIAALAKLDDNDALGFAPGATVIGNDGTPIDMSSEDGCVKGAVSNAFYGCFQGDVTHKPGTVVAGSVGDVGWFVAPYTAVITGDNPEGGPSKPEKRPVRFGGVVQKSGSTWKIVAAAYVDPISDKQLVAVLRKPASGDLSLGGQKKLAGLVAGWFTSGFASNAAPKSMLIASGTSPTEFKSGAAAIALAKSWDKLKLRPTKAEATMLGGDKIAWVRVEVEMPRKGKTDVVGMTLYAVLVPGPDAPNDWRWVSLMYHP